MPVQFYCPRWGSESIPWPAFLEQVADAGYDGIEYAIPSDVSRTELERVWEMADKKGLGIIAQHFDTSAADFPAHLDSYRRWLELLSSFDCVKINSQTGKDFFSFEQNRQLIEAAAAYGVIHETHRGKFSFAAHITHRFLETVPSLRITLDISHWVAVSESWLEDQQEAVALAISRTDHIHARIGYPEGAQVPDPRAPEWEEAVLRHLVWWDEVVAIKKQKGEALTISPEFGPYPYLVHLPFTRQPISSQWDSNLFMLDLLQKRYS